MLTTRVEGLTREEKNVPLREYSTSSSSMARKDSLLSSSLQNAFTSFWLPMVSSRKDDSTPRCAACLANRSWVFFEMSLVSRKDIGVSSTTTSAIQKLSLHMQIRVPMMVATPVSRLENPSSRPSVNISASEMILPAVSPEGCESR